MLSARIFHFLASVYIAGTLNLLHYSNLRLLKDAFLSYVHCSLWFHTVLLVSCPFLLEYIFGILRKCVWVVNLSPCGSEDATSLSSHLIDDLAQYRILC